MAETSDLMPFLGSANLRTVSYTKFHQECDFHSTKARKCSLDPVIDPFVTSQ